MAAITAAPPISNSRRDAKSLAFMCHRRSPDVECRIACMLVENQKGSFDGARSLIDLRDRVPRLERLFFRLGRLGKDPSEEAEQTIGDGARRLEGGDMAGPGQFDEGATHGGCHLAALRNETGNILCPGR